MVLIKKGAVFLLIAALVVNLVSHFGNSSIAKAANSEEKQTAIDAADDPSQAIVDAAKKLTEVSKEEQSHWKQLAEEQIRNGSVNLATIDLLDFTKSNVYKLDESNNYIVGIPIVSDDYHEMSNVSIFFNGDDSTVEQVTEYQIKRSTEDTFQLIMSLNGEEQLNEVTTEKFITAAEFQNQFHISGFSWSKFKKCSGITDITARWLAYICGTTCVITLGTGCVWCITGAVGALGGLSATCVGEAWT